MGNGIDFYQFNSGDFKTIYYGKQYSYMIEHTNKVFKNSFDMHKKIWNYSVEDKIVLFINDITDYGNGGATALPFNLVMIGINPFDNVYEVMPANERMQWLASHELTHIVMCDKPAKRDEFYRSLFFGKPSVDNTNPISMLYSYLAVPRWYSPRWFHEGIAITFETYMTGGFGRALGGFDEMMFRAMVLDSAYFYHPIGLETEGSTMDFQVGANAYLYGTRFVSYLLYKYGKEKLLAFYERDNESYAFFANQFYKIYGNNLSEVWQEWIDFEKEFQTGNLKIINNSPTTKHRNILDYTFGSASRQFFNKEKNSLIAAVNYPGNLAHFAEIDIETGDSREIAQVYTPRMYFVTSIAYNSNKNLIYCTDNNNNYRDFNIINAESGKVVKSVKYARFGELVANPQDNSLWGIRNYNGRSILSRISEPFDNFEEIYTIPFGASLFDLDISPDGKLLSGIYSTPDGRHRIVLYKISDLLNGNFEYKEIYEFEDNSASNFVFSNDGNYLFGTSYFTGASNIFRIDINTTEVKIITNAETGYFRPIQISKDSLLAYCYSAKGFNPVILQINTTLNVEPIEYFGMKVLDKNPDIKNIKLPPLNTVSINPEEIIETTYNPITEIGLKYAYPVVEGYQEFPSYGYKFNFTDDILLHSLDFSLGYSPNIQLPEKERYHFNMKWKYWEWEVGASFNKTDFYDLLGPTKRSRPGYNVNLQYHDYFLYNRKPETFDYKIRLSYWGDLKILPNYQNINFKADRLLNVMANINYSFLRTSLGGVETEQGVDYKIYLTNELVDGLSFTKIFGQASFGQLLPIRNSSVWLRLYAGKSFGEENNPFNYFYFGGFGNNYLDMYSVSRYREAESLPGRVINELAGNTYFKGLLEWNLPPVRFKKFGILPLYFTHCRLSMFAGAVGLSDESLLHFYKAATFGTQLDFELSLFYLMKAHLSFGYAVSAAQKLLSSDEFMISLKF